MNRIKQLFYTCSLLFAVVSFTACNDDDDNALSPDVQHNVDVNNWVYEMMDLFYYWTDDMPADTDRKQDPEAFFEGLLSQDDRFSIIVPDYEALVQSLDGVTKEAGYEFALVRVSGSDDVVAIVLYTKENSPAEVAGLRRGDVISQINGSTMTISNYREVIGGMSSDHTVKYRRYNEATSSFEEQGTANLTAVVLPENPNYLDTVYNIGSSKIGYYVYNFFSAGPDDEAYDNEMDQIIQGFKDQGVTSLILDLRYNSGGSVSSAKNLASLIGTGANSSKIFYENKFNQLYQNYLEDQPDGDQYLRVRFLDKAENIGSQIGGDLYILTGSRTASASELIINGLDPYMNVTIIGDTTVGKNVGSIPLDDEDNPNNPYGILPIVLKIFNSQGYSDYDEGFAPLGENVVSDFQQPMRALGDTRDPLLARAIELIEGGSIGGRKLRTEGEPFTPIMTSIDKKGRTNRLIIDDFRK